MLSFGISSGACPPGGQTRAKEYAVCCSGSTAPSPRANPRDLSDPSVAREVSQDAAQSLYREPVLGRGRGFPRHGDGMPVTLRRVSFPSTAWYPDRTRASTRVRDISGPHKEKVEAKPPSSSRVRFPIFVTSTGSHLDLRQGVVRSYVGILDLVSSSALLPSCAANGWEDAGCLARSPITKH